MKPLPLMTLVLAVLVTFAASLAHGQIYQWAISAGTVVQANTLCPGGSGLLSVIRPKSETLR